MRRRVHSILTSAAFVCVCSAGECPGSTRPTDYDFDSSQKEEVWAFVTEDATGRQIQARCHPEGLHAKSVHRCHAHERPAIRMGNPLRQLHPALAYVRPGERRPRFVHSERQRLRDDGPGAIGIRRTPQWKVRNRDRNRWSKHDVVERLLDIPQQ